MEDGRKLNMLHRRQKNVHMLRYLRSKNVEKGTIDVYLCTYIHVYILLYTYVDEDMNVYVHTYMYIYIYIYISMYKWNDECERYKQW
jgi:hypothetical protein